jgi:hypothetical protein
MKLGEKMKITTQAQISIILITMLTCFLPLATYAQQSSASASAEAKDVVLLIGEHPGIDEIDAQSAAVLIAVELRKLRIPVSDPIYKAPAKGIVYQVTLRRLGEKILVHLSQETASGTVVVEKQLWIANIEEIITAAPRLVDALVHNKPIDSTVDMESVTEHEAAELNKITGESLWNIGIFGTFIPGTDIAAEPGYEFGWSYETPAYSVGTEFRGSGNEDFTFVSWSIGGRYFFNKKNISPYAGGGLSIFGGSYSDERYYDDYSYDDDYYYDSNGDSDSGLGVYVVGGIEMLRLTKSRLKFEVRVDRPFFSFPDRDMMPITFGIFFSQNYVPGRAGFCLF